MNCVTDVDICVTDVISYDFLNLGGFMMHDRVENTVSHIDIGRVRGVYLLTDTTTGKTYVGSSGDIRMRLIQHFFCMSAKGRPDTTTYINFSKTYQTYGSGVFTAEVLEECSTESLKQKEIYWIEKLKPTENSQHIVDDRIIYSDEERANRSIRTKKLWADPEYREKAIKARLGNAYNKGYKCTPEQIENRKKAGRISNMKRSYGAEWKQEYLKRYPEYAGDLNGL